MKPAAEGYRVAVVGASSLLGKELVSILKERAFPVSRLVTPGVDEEDPDLPVVDLEAGIEPFVGDENVNASDLDFAFLAKPLRPQSQEDDKAPYLRSVKKLATGGQCSAIDLTESLSREPGGILRVPFLEREDHATPAAVRIAGSFYLSPHPATIVLSCLLLRLLKTFAIQTSVAQVFVAASEFGSPAVNELQKQTMNLLAFQKIPESVFGTQLAFNLLARFGGPRNARHNKESGSLLDLEGRIQSELKTYLDERTPVPALRLIQAPIFHSLAISLYAETEKPGTPESFARTLRGERLVIRQHSEKTPSQVEVSGSDDIVVDAPVADPNHPNGMWLWAVTDNLRLSALNAVEIAESLRT